jgi:chromate transporter
VQAVVRIGRRVLHHPLLVALAVAAFLALSVLQVPFPLVVLGAGVVGAAVHRWCPDVVAMPQESADPDDAPPLVSDDSLHVARPTGRRAALVLGIGIPLWLLPVAVAGLLAGADSVYAQQGLFFSGTALVTFGGAYAVLSFVAQRAVEVYGWLAPGEMARGLALAETTPGPLIMVVQFVAFLGAFRDPGALDPWTAGVVASLLTTWVTFVPCFLFIFLGAPYVERLRGNAALSAAMTGITAAVVGVIANLGVYFATHTLFDASRRVGLGPLTVELPDPATLDPVALGMAALAAVLLLRLRWSVLRTLGVCAVVGLAAQFLI